MHDKWTVKLDGRVRPIIEKIAHEEGRDPANMVRRLVDSALAQRALSLNVRPAAPMLTDAALAQRRA
jgi:hypothetical protein